MFIVWSARPKNSLLLSIYLSVWSRSVGSTSSGARCFESGRSWHDVAVWNIEPSTELIDYSRSPCRIVAETSSEAPELKQIDRNIVQLIPHSIYIHDTEITGRKWIQILCETSDSPAGLVDKLLFSLFFPLNPPSQPHKSELFIGVCIVSVLVGFDATVTL